jgi:CheY-like chemotaxis protein
MRVLVVDDDADIRATLALALECAGYDVRTANHGDHALQVLQAWRADVILLDLNMPVCDGWQFRSSQRDDRRIADIPVVVMTASRDLKTIGDTLGQHALLPKPFDLDRLYQQVERCRLGRPTSRQEMCGPPTLVRDHAEYER